jgi:hypothetical protein
MRAITDGRETHTKLFRVRGTDTVQLTFGIADEQTALRSPDGRLIAVQRGWREGDGYRYDTFVIDSSGGELWRVTNDPEVDGPIGWSPDGTRLLIARHLWGRYELWAVDADGLSARNLTAEFGLPTDGYWGAAFSPDGRIIAAGQRGVRELLLLDLERRVLERRALGCRFAGHAPTWSPDARWIVAGCHTRPATDHLVTVAADGSAIHELAQLPGTWTGVVAWSGDGRQYLETLRIAVDTISVAVGYGVRIGADARDRLERAVYAPLRWSIGDSAVARVDSLGFVRGRRPGTTTLVVTAGGVRADSAVVRVIPAPLDTLLYEDWSRGLDTTRWRPFGWPVSEAVRRAGPGGAGAFVSHGDFNWPSGVLSVADLELRNGLTVELPLRFFFTGDLWQELVVNLVNRDSNFIAGERNPSGSIAGSTFHGPASDGAATSPTYSCGQVREWPVAEANRGWHRLVIQLRPDWIYECWLDGRFLGAVPIAENHRPAAVALMLAGRTHKTRLYHGPVLVTRGLRY